MSAEAFPAIVVSRSGDTVTVAVRAAAGGQPMSWVGSTVEARRLGEAIVLAAERADVALYADLYAELGSCAAVARRVGVSASTVSLRLRLAGVPVRTRGRVPAPGTGADLAALYAGCGSVSGVAARLGVSYGAAWKWLHLAGVRMRRRGRRDGYRPERNS